MLLPSELKVGDTVYVVEDFTTPDGRRINRGTIAQFVKVSDQRADFKVDNVPLPYSFQLACAFKGVRPSLLSVVLQSCADGSYERTEPAYPPARFISWEGPSELLTEEDFE